MQGSRNIFFLNMCNLQGRIQDSEKGGHNFVTVNMVIVCKVHNLACKSRGSGGMPPQKILKN